MSAIKNYFGKKSVDPLKQSQVIHDKVDEFEMIKEPTRKQVLTNLPIVIKTENELVKRLKICTKIITSLDFNYTQFFTSEHDKFLFNNNVPCYFKFTSIGNLICPCDKQEHLLLVYTIRTNSDAFNTNLYSIMKVTDDVYRNEYTGLTLDYYLVKKIQNGEIFLMLCVDDIVQLDKSAMPKVNSVIDNLITYMDTFTYQD